MQSVSATKGLQVRVLQVRVLLALSIGALAALAAAACSDDIPSEPQSAVRVIEARATSFVDDTEGAGLLYVQHEKNEPPECLFDNIARAAGEQTGALCDAERMTGGAAAGDYDGDGAIDLIVTRLDGHDLLFRNRGDGTFEEVAADAGLDVWELNSNGAVWGDVDNDGDLDLFVTTVGDTRHYLFINEGGQFVEEGLERGAAVDTGDRRIGFSASRSATMTATGLSICTSPSGARPSCSSSARRSPESACCATSAPTPPGYFEDVTVAAGVQMQGVVSQTQAELTEGTFAFGSTFVDLDGDGWPDLAIASDFGTSRLFWNNGDGTFSDGTLDASVGTAQNAMGTTFGDYDADGDLDWFVTSIYSFQRGSPGADEEGTKNGNRLFRNDGDRTFTDATDAAGVRNGSWGWGAAFFDADNDGDLDLTMTNGMEMMPGYDADAMRYWENAGNGTYISMSTLAGLDDLEDGKGLLIFDADNDGDLDVFVVNNASEPRFYRNESRGAGAWLRVSLEGSISNQQGLGAQVSVFAAGLPEQVREAGVASHFLGQSEDTLHFGLDDASVADVIIRWPASGLVTTLEDVPANSSIKVVEGESGYRVLDQ